ncbi:H(+)-transporting V1 sector ATPase subunit G, partial [Quaeritorhiza haematococci]
AAASSQGIQTLLEAEKEASKIVQKARQYRVQRLKDARTEAAKEIEELKAQKMKEFQAFEQQYSGSNDAAFTKISAETEERLAAVNAAYRENKDMVIEKMLVSIAKVKPEIHRNLKINAA